jgi:hypothetical protein
VPGLARRLSSSGCTGRTWRRSRPNLARRSADPHVVADLTADTFVTAITSFGSFDPRRGTARAWVFGIARHVYEARQTLLAGGGTLAAVAAVAGVLVAASTTPAAPAAYAVTKNANGTITLAVYQKSGIAGANARLHKLGDKQVVVVPIEPGCASTVTPPAVPGKGHLITTGISRSPNGTVTVDAHGIPAADILVIGVGTSGHTSFSVGTLASPPAPSCVGLPTLPPGNGGSGS